MSFNSVYTQIWRVLLHLAADPFPEVSDLAMKVLNSIAYKVGGGPASPLFSLLRLQPFAGEQRCVLWRLGMQAGLWGTLETCSTFTMLLSGSGARARSAGASFCSLLPQGQMQLRSSDPLRKEECFQYRPLGPTSSTSPACIQNQQAWLWLLPVKPLMNDGKL